MSDSVLMNALFFLGVTLLITEMDIMTWFRRLVCRIPFMCKVVTCDYCVAFWISLFATRSIYQAFAYAVLVYFGALVIYNLDSLIH